MPLGLAVCSWMMKDILSQIHPPIHHRDPLVLGNVRMEQTPRYYWSIYRVNACNVFVKINIINTMGYPQPHIYRLMIIEMLRMCLGPMMFTVIHELHMPSPPLTTIHLYHKRICLLFICVCASYYKHGLRSVGPCCLNFVPQLKSQSPSKYCFYFLSLTTVSSIIKKAISF